jgi:predicted DNA-binding helix-hairpin-helix protein
MRSYAAKLLMPFYTAGSPEAVSELQHSLSKVVDEELISDLRQSELFSIMLDESTDRSTVKTLIYCS